MKNDSQPLVSIPVITYNSSKYVIETLESIKSQTYQNLELIVSDDCSTDNTVELCRNWIEKNKDRFVRAELLTVEKNTGISANCNRGEKNANGIFVKTIAGDDYLDSLYVEKVITYFLMHEEVGAVFTSSIMVYENDNKKEEKEDTGEYRSGEIFDDLFWLKYWPKAPSWIFKKSVLENIGYNDETIWVEDYLKVLKVAQNYKIGWVDEYLVYYRKHSENNGSMSIRLLEAHLATIDRFQEYHGYKKRKMQLLNELYEIAESENPKYLVRNKKYNRYLITVMYMCVKRMCQYNFPRLRQLYKNIKDKVA